MLTVLIPCHKAGFVDGGDAQIVTTIRSLQSQTRPADRIIVLVNNCRDSTRKLAIAAGVEAEDVPPNPHLKAGALNWWLDRHLSVMDDADLVMVMDADSELCPEFLEHALRYVARGHHAVGGVFTGKSGGGFVGMLQRNEYARYARDIARKRGRTLVLTGTATVFTAACLKAVVLGRQNGCLPRSGATTAQVYDTCALTEDNELTYALLHLGYRIIAPPECRLTTEVMETWPGLVRQRYRWKRGAVENNRNYGVTADSAKYWALQVWGAIGMSATAVYALTLVVAIAMGALHLKPLWLAVTVVFAVERAVSVRLRGWRQMLVGALLVVEMPYDLVLQATQARAMYGAWRNSARSW